jgi:hypothetical protein
MNVLQVIIQIIIAIGAALAGYQGGTRVLGPPQGTCEVCDAGSCDAAWDGGRPTTVAD